MLGMPASGKGPDTLGSSVITPPPARSKTSRTRTRRDELLRGLPSARHLLTSPVTRVPLAAGTSVPLGSVIVVRPMMTSGSPAWW